MVAVLSQWEPHLVIELEGYMQYYYGLVCKGAINTANFAIQSKADPRSVLAELLVLWCLLQMNSWMCRPAILILASM